MLMTRKEQFGAMLGHKLWGHPMFYELLFQMADLHSRKNHDYSGEGEPFQDLKAARRMGVDPSLKVALRIQDKEARFENFCKMGTLLVADESVEDTLIDMANFSLIEIILLREAKTDAGK